MRFRIVLLSLLLLGSISGKAQVQLDTAVWGTDTFIYAKSNTYFEHMQLVKFNMLTMLDPNPAVQLSYERAFGRSTSYQITLGYLYAKDWWSDGLVNDSRLRGLRTRLELRHYHVMSDAYIGMDAMYRYRAWNEIGTMGYNCTDEWVCDYFRDEVLHTVKQHGFAAHLKVGGQGPIKLFGDFKDRVFYDVWFGLGARYISGTTSEIESNGTLQPNGDFFNIDRTDGNYLLPSLTAGFQLGYRFR